MQVAQKAPMIQGPWVQAEASGVRPASVKGSPSSLKGQGAMESGP